MKIDKFEELKTKTEEDLKKRYPNKKIKVVYHGEERDSTKQSLLKKEGKSTTNTSLHMVGGARDFNIFIDGKIVGNKGEDFKIYKDVLWKNAKDLGLHHLKEDGFGGTDPYHIGLVEEKGDGTAFDRLFKLYPELTKDENVIKQVNDLKNNNQDKKFDVIINAFEQNKTKTMETNDKDNSLEEYKKLQDKLELQKYRYEQGKGIFTPEENKKLYNKLSEVQKEVDAFKMKMVSDFQSKEEKKYNDANDILDKKIKEAESIGDYKEAKKLELQKTVVKERKEKFDKDKVDFSKSKEKHISKEVLNKRPGAFTEGEDISIPDIDLDKVNKTFDNLFAEKLKEQPKEDVVTKEQVTPGQPTEDSTGTGSSTTTTTTTESDVNVHDMDFGEEAGVDDVLAPNKNWEEEYKKVDQEIADLQAAKQPVYQRQDTYQNESDVFGTLMDVGRGIAGYIGATEEVPTYSRGSMFNSAMGRADARKDEGLSAVELAARERAGEEVYGYDIKNIARASGGSAGAYLGNVGSAVQRLYGQKAETAAQDEAVRRLNNQNFQGMALQDEQINRQIFQDELAQTMATKQAGAGLFADATRNIQDRIDYNRQYGNDSIYARHMNAKINDIESSIYDRNLASKKRLDDMMREAEGRKSMIAEKMNANAPTVKGTATANENNTKVATPSKVTTTVNPVVDSSTLNYKDESNPYIQEEADRIGRETLEKETALANEEADMLIGGKRKRKSLFRKNK